MCERFSIPLNGQCHADQRKLPPCLKQELTVAEIMQCHKWLDNTNNGEEQVL